MSQHLMITSPWADGSWKCVLLASLLIGPLFVGCCPKAAKRSDNGSMETPELAVWVESPGRYLGKKISVGGRVVSASTGSIELLAYPGNDCGEADFGELPIGRILVKSPLALTPGRFPPGREVTVSGRIAGTQPTESEGIRRELPVLEATELATPAPPVFFPWPSFGFSFSGGF